MSASLVGSEMCIRDRACRARSTFVRSSVKPHYMPQQCHIMRPSGGRAGGCLLYTSDAADDM
eukprot:13174718-Alexandrium_andersonii.AAC.1